jgi:serine/threonine-protein kinase
MGSPSYMSPEQMVSAHDVDARTDIWSLGVTLYELLAGKPPFVADSMVQLSVVVREKEPPPLEGIPDELANVITKCLAKDPTARYESVAALVAELAPFAPEDAKGLVMRHARRDSISGNAAALAITALETRTDAARMKPDVDRGSDASDDSSTTAAQLTDSRPGHAPGTFAPLQSTLAEAKPSAERPRPRWPIFAIAASVIAAIAVGGAALSRSSPPAGSATQEAATPIAKDARAESVDIPVLASAAPRASTAPTASAIPLSSAEKPRSTLARSNNPSLSAPVVAPAAPLHSAAASAPEPPSSATAPAPRARPEAPKRRELDRDDP